MKKQIALPLGIFLAGIGVIAVLVVSKPKPTPSPPAAEPALVKVSVTPAKQETLRLSVISQGTVQPRREIDLIAQVSGQVVSVQPNFLDGGFFQPDETLIQIDSRDYASAVLTAKSQVAEAEHRLAQEQGQSRQASREWRDLGSKNANDLFLRKPQLAAAEANLEAAKGELARAELNLERTRISVPFPGRIKETTVDLGEFASVGARLATVYDSTHVEIRLPLTDQQAALIDLPLVPGMAEARHPNVVIRGSVAGRDYEWEGRITRTDAFVDSNSRMYYAVAEVAQPFARDVPLLPGLFVEAEIEGKEMDGVVLLPRSALFEQNKVITLDHENKVVAQKVKVLRKTESQVWVQAELAEDTLIALKKQGITPVGTIVEPLLDEAIPQAVVMKEKSEKITSTSLVAE